jgi:hypothetical protein
MPFMTRGKVKVSLGTATSLKIIPINDYRLTHRKVVYAMFANIDDKSTEARCFKEDQIFDVNAAALRDHLVDSALKEICLEITIDDSTPPKVTNIQIPA